MSGKDPDGAFERAVVAAWEVGRDGARASSAAGNFESNIRADN
jgi:hypothetical protein